MIARLGVVLLAASMCTAVAGPATVEATCAAARNPVEQQLCADPQLQLLDARLNRYYRAARQALGQASTCLRDDQRQWLRQVRDTCDGTACLQAAYRERLGVLEGVVPGMLFEDSGHDRDSMAATPLILAIAPAVEDTPPRAGTRSPWSAEGQLREVEGGFTVAEAEATAGAGETRATASAGTTLAAWPLSAAALLRLQVLASMPDTRYRLRGWREPQRAGTSPEFSPYRCILVYQLPDDGGADQPVAPASPR